MKRKKKEKSKIASVVVEKARFMDLLLLLFFLNCISPYLCNFKRVLFFCFCFQSYTLIQTQPEDTNLSSIRRSSSAHRSKIYILHFVLFLIHFLKINFCHFSLFSIFVFQQRTNRTNRTNESNWLISFGLRFSIVIYR